MTDELSLLDFSESETFVVATDDDIAAKAKRYVTLVEHFLGELKKLLTPNGEDCDRKIAFFSLASSENKSRYPRRYIKKRYASPCSDGCDHSRTFANCEIILKEESQSAPNVVRGRKNGSILT